MIAKNSLRKFLVNQQIMGIYLFRFLERALLLCGRQTFNPFTNMSKVILPDDFDYFLRNESN